MRRHAVKVSQNVLMLSRAVQHLRFGSVQLASRSLIAANALVGSNSGSSPQAMALQVGRFHTESDQHSDGVSL